jgi:sugar phosphate isomerase/epimerase
MVKPPIGVQLYSVREAAAEDFPGTLRKIAAMGYVGVELAGLNGMTPVAVRELIDELGMVACSSHAGIPTDENLAENVETAKILGYNYQVGGWGPPEFASVAEIQKIAAEAQAGVARMRPTGMKLAIHNHYWEFDHKLEGKYPHELFMEAAPDVLVQIDTYWAQVGGADPAEVVRKCGARAPLLHIKDGPGVKDKDMLPIGTGVVDWTRVFAAAGAAEWAIVELDTTPGDMFEALDESCKYLVKNGFVTGR